jgi:N-methylhydantoinase B/oxoprolinase/acetone carboxylase alpha subunit
MPASAGSNSLNNHPLAGKAKVKLSRGDILRITTPGGGGWG